MCHPPDLLNTYSNSRMSHGQVGQVGTAAGSGSHTDGGGVGGSGGNAAATSGYFIMALKGKHVEPEGIGPTAPIRDQ
jgi:hypothetical protein